MPSFSPSFSLFLSGAIVLAFLSVPTLAFGAGNIGKCERETITTIADRS